MQAFAGSSPPEPECRLSVVIPALNEANRLPPTLERIASYLAAHEVWLPAEIIVVDDGSADGTGETARRVSPVRGIVLRVESHAENRGKGAAVRTGFSRATGDLVLLTDADLSAPIEELAALTLCAGDGGIAIGSRAVDRCLIENPQPRYRDMMGRSFNLVVRLLGLSRFHDTQCGFKLFPGNVARALAAVQRIDGFAFDVEHLVIADSWGLPVEEVAVRWRHVEESRVLAVHHSTEMMRDLLRLRWWRFTGALPAMPDGLK